MLLRVQRGAVFNCHGGGTVFNETLALRLGKWYYKLPPTVRTPRVRVEHLGGAALSLCVPYSDGFQHNMLDMFSKLSIMLPYIRKHYPNIKVSRLNACITCNALNAFYLF
jgi:hypothetical protein